MSESFQVLLTIHHATFIPKMDVFHHADPFFEVHYPSLGCILWQSKAINDTATPVWNSYHLVKVTPSVSSFAMMVLYDEDTFVNDKIGVAKIPLNEPASHLKVKVDLEADVKPGKEPCCVEYSVVVYDQAEKKASTPSSVGESSAAGLPSSSPYEIVPVDCPWQPDQQLIRKWVESFAAYDRNKSGTISRREMARFLKERCGKGSAEEAKRIVSRADANNSGTIEIPEFIRSMCSQEHITVPMIHELAALPDDLFVICFRSVDSNGDMNLNVKELVRFFKGFGMTLNVNRLTQTNFTQQDLRQLLRNFSEENITH